jgi:hypothetical protein
VLVRYPVQTNDSIESKEPDSDEDKDQFSSFSKRFGSYTILFPSSVGFFASIKNLILQERDVHLYLSILPQQELFCYAG